MSQLFLLQSKGVLIIDCNDSFNASQVNLKKLTFHKIKFKIKSLTDRNVEILGFEVIDKSERSRPRVEDGVDRADQNGSESASAVAFSTLQLEVGILCVRVPESKIFRTQFVSQFQSQKSS